MVDAAVFNVWSCFVGMQTGMLIYFASSFLQPQHTSTDMNISGNTVYTGLGLSGQPYSQPYRWAKSGAAITSFCIGCYIFARISRWLGPLKRSTMILNMAAQVILCFAACAMVVTGFVPKDAGERLPKDFIVLLPLSLLALSSAGQIVMSRFLGYVS